MDWNTASTALNNESAMLVRDVTNSENDAVNGGGDMFKVISINLAHHSPVIAPCYNVITPIIVVIGVFIRYHTKYCNQKVSTAI